MASAPVSLPQGDPDLKFSAGAKLRLGVEILGTYARVRWLVLTKPLPEVVRILREGQQGDRRGELELAAGGGWRYALSVVKTLRILPTDKRCLMRSLVLLAVLARRGARTTLVIGVRSDPDFGAHAWIEHDGTPLLDPGSSADGRLAEL
jgi:hypothetical protein